MSDIPKGILPNEVQVFNPEGELVAIPAHQARDAQDMGFRIASPEEAHSYLNEQKFGGAGQTALTFAEGAARGVSFGLSSAVERGLGVDPEDIRNREETNPVASMTGEGAGIVGSTFIPVAGAGNIAAHVGEGAASLAAHALPALGEANVIGKIGSAAVKGAVENAIFASGDEVSKAILQDPNQSFQTAMADITLSGLIGGAVGGGIGSISPLWEATAGPKARAFLNMITDRANGETIGATAATDALEKAGADIPDAVKAMSSDRPELRELSQGLSESSTMSGEKLRADLTSAKESVSDSVARTLTGGESITAKEAGDQAKEILAKDIESRGSGVRQAYDAVAPSAEVALDNAAKSSISENLTKLGSEFGAEGSPIRQEFERFAERVAMQKTVGQVDKLMTELGSEWSVANRSGNFELRRGLQEIRDTIREGVNGVLDKAIPGAKEAAKAARETYASTIEHIQEIAKAGGLGKVKSIGQFQEALEKIPSEKLASRLFDRNNVRALEYLRESYPQVHEMLAKQYRSQLLEKATTAKGFNASSVFREVAKLPEEVRKMVFKPEQLEHLSAAKEFLGRGLPERMNPSGTARTLDKLWQHMPAGGGAMVSALTGHNPVMGLIAGEASKLLGRDLPDAAKLSLLKFLGSSGPVDASAWKTAADLIERTYKGQKLIERATKSVFQAGKAVLPEAMYPDEKKTQRLDKKLKELAQNPEPLFDVGGKTAHYMPEHAQAMGQTAANAVTWLNEQRPREPQAGLLDSKPPIPQEVQDHYTRTLQIAEQPLVSLQHLKDGTLQASDVATVQTLYPQLFSKLQQGLVSELIDAKSNDVALPYHMTLGLGLFLAQPLDGTMTPEGIQALQSSNSPQEVQTGSQNQIAQAPHGSMKALAQAPGQFMTPGQKRESSHSV